MTRTCATLIRRLRRDDGAAAMVEFAIVAPLLFALLFGIIDFGRVFFLYNNLTNAAREGARLGAVLMTASCAAGTQTTVINAVRARINDAGGSTATVNVTCPGLAPAQTVRVQIQNYPFNPVTFFVIGSARRLNVRSEFRLEQQ